MTGNAIPAASGKDQSDTRDSAPQRHRGGAFPTNALEPAHVTPAASGNPWLVSVIQQHQHALVLYVWRFTRDLERARDIVQDAFLKLLAEQRKGNRAQVEPHLAEWLFTVCRNRAVDVKRKESRMTQLDQTPADAMGDAQPGHAPSPASSAESRDDAARALQLLDHLPPNQREVIRLKFQHGLSYKQISAVTNLSVTNVGFLIHTGLATLRERMS